MNQMSASTTSPAVMLDLLKEERERRNAAASLYEFVRQSWHVVEPGVPFIGGWHIEQICEHLEACSGGDLRKLLINIPPRHFDFPTFFVGVLLWCTFSRAPLSGELWYYWPQSPAVPCQCYTWYHGADARISPWHARKENRVTWTLGV